VTIQLNIADAKARLSELIDLAQQGEDVVLARAGKPVARIVMTGHGIARASLFGALSHLGSVPDEAWSPEPVDAAYGFEDEIPDMKVAAAPPCPSFRDKD
jgi:antitoxin (DNA-binding transcriptional repressor) of toxin-antitoxin stability system